MGSYRLIKEMRSGKGNLMYKNEEDQNWRHMAATEHPIG